MKVSAAETLRWVGALGIATIAVMRCVIVFAPRIVFDVDPAVDPTPLPGLGPLGSLVLDVLLLAACGIGLLGEALARRGLDWRLLLLALIPVPVVLWHGAHDALDLWRGCTWLAAACASVVVAHLARDRAVRVVLLALLVAVLVPIILRGASQSALHVDGISAVGGEHAETIAEFEANKEVFFADRGWPPDSREAMIYERRIRQPDPRGWFPTTNIYASMMAFGLVLFAGLTVAAVRDRATRSWVWLFGAGFLVAAAALMVSRSKGAVLASLAGFVLVLAPLAGERVKAFLARYGGAVAVALVALALLGVVVRGTLLPESWMDERSLLFRWHYLVGAARVFGDHLLAGVGPDGFQAAYTMVRSPRSPEEVTSAHSMFADWLALLGVSGAAWVGLTLVLVWRSGGVRPELEAEPSSPRLPLLAAGVVAAFGLLPALTVQASALTTVGRELSRGLGILGYVAAAATLGLVLGRLPSRSVDRALACAALALVIHGQIEMTFFDPGSVTWMLCALGLAGGAVARPPNRRAGIAASVVLFALMLVVLFSGPWKMAGPQSLVLKAADRLYPPGESRVERIAQREAAAEQLQYAYSLMPSWVMPQEAATRQLLQAATLVEGRQRLDLIDAALGAAWQAVNDHGGPTSVALAGEAAWFRAAETNAPEDWEEAIDLNRRLTELDPHGIGSWQRYGDVLWDAGRRAEAAAAYRRALENDANFALDPLKRLSDREREVIRERLEPLTDATSERAAPPL